MTRFLYLSPHFDDVVLSSGGTIAARLEAGDEVVVATVFSGRERGAGAEEASIYDRRRAEDRAATGLLSAPNGNACQTACLGLADAPFRDSYYSSFETIVNGPASQETGAALGARIGEVRESLRPDVLVAPLGVGRHVDHRLVFEATVAQRWEGELRFYEDRPYAFVPGAVNYRWASLGAIPNAFSPGPWNAEFPSISFLASYRGEPEMKAEPRKIRRWRSASNVYEASTPRLSSEQVQKRNLAIAAYTSQLAPLFDATPDIAESAIAALYGARPEVEWRAAIVDSPTKES